jgi:hypothetical protein
VQGITWRLGFAIDAPTQPEGACPRLLPRTRNRHQRLYFRPAPISYLSDMSPLEWQDHPADLNLPLTPDLYVHGVFLPFLPMPSTPNSIQCSVNNPVAIWETVAAKLLV